MKFRCRRFLSMITKIPAVTYRSGYGFLCRNHYLHIVAQRDTKKPTLPLYIHQYRSCQCSRRYYRNSPSSTKEGKFGLSMASQLCGTRAKVQFFLNEAKTCNRRLRRFCYGDFIHDVSESESDLTLFPGPCPGVDYTLRIGFLTREER